MKSWMQDMNGDFVDIHDTLRCFSDVREFFQVVEANMGILDYCNGRNASARWIFQIYSMEFIESLVKILENEETILEVMAGDGCNREIKVAVHEPIR